MYQLTTSTTYKSNVNYYSKSGNVYTLMVSGTDYTVGDSVPSNSVYVYFAKDKIYIDEVEMPVLLRGLQHGLNDVDLDAYTNLSGKTVRNRIREDVRTLDFTYTVLNGNELHDILQLRKQVWFQCTHFDEKDNAIITKKMYCGPVKYTTEYIDSNNDNSIYTSILFGFVEE